MTGRPRGTHRAPRRDVSGTRYRRRFPALIGALTLLGTMLAPVALLAAPAAAAPATTSCTVTGDLSATSTSADVDLAATAPATVDGLSTFALTGTTIQVTLPGTLFDEKLASGDEHFGDTLSAELTGSLVAAGTVEGSQAFYVATTAPIAEDPGNLGHAAPIVFSGSLADTTWNPAAMGAVAFRWDEVALGVGNAGIGISVRCPAPDPAPDVATISVVAAPTVSSCVADGGEAYQDTFDAYVAVAAGVSPAAVTDAEPVQFGPDPSIEVSVPHDAIAEATGPGQFFAPGSTIGVSSSFEIDASNTDEAGRTLSGSAATTTIRTDPGDPGRTTGLDFAVTVPTSTWTPTGGGHVRFTQGPWSATLTNGPATVTLTCTPADPQPALAYVTVTRAAPEWTSSTPSDTAVVGTAYGPYTFAASGFPAPTYSVAPGSLPDGLTLDPDTGVLSGVPATAGEYTFDVTASNGVEPDNVTTTATITVYEPEAPAFTASTPPTTANVGDAYSYTFGASGHPAPSFSVATGALPDGLALDLATGVLSGTPTAGGSYTFSVEASNPTDTVTTGDITITVTEAPVFTAATPPATAPLGDAYAYTFAASGVPDASFSVATGALPDGLALDPVSGALSGTTTTTGAFTFSVEATNTAGSVTTGDLTITVTEAPALTAATPPSDGRVGASYGPYAFAASGFPAPAFSVASGALPVGLALDAATGTLSGVPSAPGVYTFSVEATNVAGSDVSDDVTIAVSGAPDLVAASPPSTAGLGDPFSYTFTATGYPAPLFLVACGELPPGLSLDLVTGVLSGTPTTHGAYTFTVKTVNAFGLDSTGEITITVGDPPAFLAASPTPGRVGWDYSYRFFASGDPAPTFSVGSGALPDGWSLDPETGVVSGKAYDQGYYTFSVEASNAVGTASTGDLTVVVGRPPEFDTGNPRATLQVGVPFSFTYEVDGFPTPTLSIDTYHIPAGLSFDPATGVLSGVPTQSRVYQFYVWADNAIGGDSVLSDIAVNPADAAPVFTAASPPTTRNAGAGYSYTFAASGFPAPSFAVASGGLPPGLTLAGAGGVLSGTPTVPGVYTFAVSASNRAGSVTTGDITITVRPAPVFTAATPPAGAEVGEPFSYTFAASGDPAPTFARASGALPDGLVLDPVSGVLSGVPTAAGDHTFTVSASNAVGTAVTGAITITVGEAPVFTASSPPVEVAAGDGFAYTFAASGDPAPTFSVASGALPPGLALDPVTGVLSGTPTAAGDHTFTVSASNVVGTATTADVTVAVLRAPELAAAFPPAGRVGDDYTYTFDASGHPAPTFSVAPGALPPGLALDPATGVLSGTPTAAGDYVFGVEAINGSGVDATGVLTITVGAGECRSGRAPYWRGWDIARRVIADPDGPGGWTLDGWGAIHAWGCAPALTGGAYWPGWDIARDLAVDEDGVGYLLDGWGGLHPVGGAPRVTDGPYWKRWDIARKLVLNPAGPGGWVLDGWGAVHAFGGAPRLATSAYWPRHDFARDLVVSADGTSGYVLDADGGLHPVGDAGPARPAPSGSGVDMARRSVLDPTGPGGWVLDGSGTLHEWGGAPPLDGGPTWTGPGLARDMSWRADGTGYILDAWGGIHPVGVAPTP